MWRMTKNQQSLLKKDEWLKEEAERKNARVKVFH